MKGFENIKERVELREKFKKETGDNWENSQNEPDIDYVLWLESKLFAIPDVSKRSELLRFLEWHYSDVDCNQEQRETIVDQYLKQ